jgi:hypothetical protein
MNLQAKKLIKKFRTSSTGRMTRENIKHAPAQPLFHYTNETALYSIINLEEFWFTSVYHMDDDKELSFGYGIAHSLLAEAMTRENIFVQQFLKPLVDDFKFDKIKARFEFYSASFGQKDDAQQWTDYASGGSGVAIGLSPAFFTVFDVKDQKPEETIFLAKVIYGEASAKVRYAGLIDSAIWTLNEAYRRALCLWLTTRKNFYTSSPQKCTLKFCGIP